jgi:hypothetical protein
MAPEIESRRTTGSAVPRPGGAKTELGGMHCHGGTRHTPVPGLHRHVNGRMGRRASDYGRKGKAAAASLLPWGSSWLTQLGTDAGGRNQ